MSIQEYVRFEKEYLQYVTYVNPTIADFYYIVVDFKTFKDTTKPHVVLRQIQTGEEVKTRIKQGKIYKQNPFGEFAILKIEGFTMDNKKKLINGEWQTTDELEPIMEFYEVIKNE
jgi:DNA polymerase-3 subunit alpha